MASGVGGQLFLVSDVADNSSLVFVTPCVVLRNSVWMAWWIKGNIPHLRKDSMMKVRSNTSRNTAGVGVNLLRKWVIPYEINQ